jgi:predicted N-acetyltransferase YhbS
VAHLRSEEPDDRDAIAAVTAAAFGQQREARMVDAIRSSDAFVPRSHSLPSWQARSSVI